MDRREFRAYWRGLLRSNKGVPHFVLVDDYGADLADGFCIAAIATADDDGGIMDAWRWWEQETYGKCNGMLLYWDAYAKMFVCDNIWSKHAKMIWEGEE